jgi:hypothetical protein
MEERVAREGVEAVCLKSVDPISAAKCKPEALTLELTCTQYITDKFCQPVRTVSNCIS